MLAIHVIQQIRRDARMREAADKIHAEVGHLMDDMERLHGRVMNLQKHFGQANEDLQQILISAEKVEKARHTHQGSGIRRGGSLRTRCVDPCAGTARRRRLDSRPPDSGRRSTGPAGSFCLVSAF